MTHRQRAFVDTAAVTLIDQPTVANATQVYAEATNRPTLKTGYGVDLANQPAIRKAICEAVFKTCSPARIAARLSDLLDAESGRYYEGGKVGSEPEHFARIAAINTLMKLADPIGSGATIIADQRSLNFDVNLNPQLLTQIADTLTKLNAALALTPAAPIPPPAAPSPVTPDARCSPDHSAAVVSR